MSDTTFVVMYHPNLGNVQVDAPLQAVSTYQSHGWLLLDPGATAPPVASPYLTQPAADSRYLRDWVGAEVLTAGAVRVTPDGHVITRTADGTTRSTYDATEAALWTVVGAAPVLSVVGQVGAVSGTQIAADPALRVALVSPLPTVGSLTYNTDGTIATDADGNSYTWNTDGTPHTQTKGGVTRTYTWNADGTLASVS